MRPINDTPQNLLGRWYADPLERNAAHRLLKRADSRRVRCARRGAPCRVCDLMRLVAGFWLGLDTEGAYERLWADASAPIHSRILTRQIYGQLLMSRRLTGAHEHLTAAFAAASDLFTPGDYFTVMHRNAILRHLPLSKQPLPPLGLKQLLDTARVAAELQRSAPSRRTYFFDRKDTFG